MSGGGLCGWEEAKDMQEYADNAKYTLHYLCFETVGKDDDCFLRCFLLCLPKNFLSAGVTNIFLFQKSDRAKIRRHRRRESHR